MEKLYLKKYLLSTNVFLDNEYLSEYLGLIFDNLDKSFNCYYENHHVLPSIYYKHLYNCKTRHQSDAYAKKDKNNFIVKLLYKDHCKAHWLLYFCTKDYMKQANEAAVRYISEMYTKLTGIEKHKFEFVQEDFDLLQNYMNDIVNDEDSRYWKADEIDILKANYTLFGPDYCVKLLPKHTKYGILSEARKLNLIYTKYWTEEEINFLILNYKTKGITYCQSTLKNRTRNTIIRKAHELGLKTDVVDLPIYTEDELNFLKIYYPIHGAKYCAKQLNRTPSSIHGIVTKFKIKYINNHFWTDDKIDFLKNNYPKYGGCYCAKYLNTTNKNVFKEASKLGLVRNSKRIKNNSWTDEENAILIQYYPLEGGKVYKRFTNRSYAACRQQANNLGLTRRRKQELISEQGKNNIF